MSFGSQFGIVIAVNCVLGGVLWKLRARVNSGVILGMAVLATICSVKASEYSSDAWQITGGALALLAAICYVWLPVRVGRWVIKFRRGDKDVPKWIPIVMNAWDAFWARAKVALWVGLALLTAYVVAGPAIIFLAPSSKLGYELRYNVPETKIDVEKCPYDCDWGTAPIGAKHCHYEKRVVHASTALSSDGKTPLISYDEGKTWAPNAYGAEQTVVVSWSKVED